jgi:hypothetical protein
MLAFVLNLHYTDLYMEFVDHLMSRRYMRVVLSVAWSMALFLVLANVTVRFLSPKAASSARVQNLQELTSTDGQVAGLVDQITSAPTPTFDESAATQDLSPTPEQKNDITPSKTKPSKKNYIIALYGDSMLDVLGDETSYFESQLKKKYPDVTFSFYNYSVGAQNVEDGLLRFHEPYDYRGRAYQAIDRLDPDVIFLGSFAYNPFVPHDRDKHWLTYAKLIEEAKKLGSDVYVVAEIAPLRYDFGNGPQGVNWERAVAYEHSGKIIQQLENAIGLAKNLNVSLIDTYTPSIANQGKKEGKAEYVSRLDGIHPSVEGAHFMIDKMVMGLKLQ